MSSKAWAARCPAIHIAGAIACRRPLWPVRVTSGQVALDQAHTCGNEFASSAVEPLPLLTTSAVAVLAM
eukprot:2176226-Alexandrium_andersonii.AAC.1